MPKGRCNIDYIERYVRSLTRTLGADPSPGRDATAAQLAARLGVPRLQHDYRHGLRRGRCRKRGCLSRYGIVRVTIDTRDPERTDRSSVIECALCGHIWTACALPDLRIRNGALPRILLTLILPPRRGEGERVWYNRRGRAIRVGTDALIVRDATYTQLADALADWRGRSERDAARRTEARERRDSQEAADIAAHRERMAEMAAARAQRERMAAIDAALAACESPLV